MTDKMKSKWFSGIWNERVNVYFVNNDQPSQTYTDTVSAIEKPPKIFLSSWNELTV